MGEILYTLPHGGGLSPARGADLKERPMANGGTHKSDEKKKPATTKGDDKPQGAASQKKA